MKSESNDKQGAPPPAPEMPAPAAKMATLDQDRIFAFVCAMRRSFQFSAMGKALCWLGLATLMVVAVDVTTGLGPELRRAAWGVLILGALVLVVGHGVARARRFKMQEGVQTIERGNPEVGQMFRTAHEVSKLPDPEAQGVSPTLAEGLLRRAASKLRSLNPSKLLPRRVTAAWVAAGVSALAIVMALYFSWPDFRTGLHRLARPGAGITFTKVEIATKDSTYSADRHPHILAEVSGRPSGSATLVVEQEDGSWTEAPMERLEEGPGFEAIVTGRTDSFRYYVKAGDGTSETMVMENVDPAHLVSSAAEVSYPEYTGLDNEKFETADVSALEGSQVELRFELSAPMSEASLHFPEGERLPLQLDGRKAVTAHTMERGEVVYELRGVDAKGREIDPLRFRLKGDVDELPEVELLEPTEEIRVTAVAEVPVRVRARDDFGVAQLGLVLEVKGKGGERHLIEKTLSEKDRRDVSEVVDAMLEEYPLTIRDNIRVYAYAKDHKPRDGARAVSKLVGIDIKPFMRKWRFGGTRFG